MEWIAIALALPFGALLTFSLNRSALGPWIESDGQHWTERARALYPARVGAATNVYTVPAMFGLAWKLLAVSSMASALAVGLSALVGAVAGTLPFDQRITGPWKLGEWIRTVLVAWGTQLLLISAFIAAALSVDSTWSTRTFAIFGGYLLWHGFLVTSGLPWMMRMTGQWKPCDGRLAGVVERVCQAAAVSVPKTSVVESRLPLAFAFPFTRELLFSSRLVALANDRHLEAVTAHELAHLKEPMAVSLSRLVGSLSWTPWILLKPLMANYHAAGYLIAAGIWWALRRFALSIARREEIRADTAATESQSHEGDYAEALELIYREAMIPAVMPKRKVPHPDLYDRMLSAGVEPSYPRPGPPKTLPAATHLLAVICGALFGLLLVWH